MVAQVPPWAGYSRVSRVGDRVDTLISPELQQQRITAYAEGRGLEVVMLEPELDVSGGAVERPILGEAIAGVESGRFAGIIVAQLDRLSRMGIEDALATIRRIEGSGGQVIAVAESFDASTPEGEMGRNVMLSLGNMQLRRYSQQFAAAKERAVRQGIWIPPTAPLGYQRGPDRRLIPDPRTRDVVTAAFRARARGESWSSLAQMIGRGQTLAAKLIRNRVYLGEIHFGEWVNSSAHEALVDVGLFEAAQLVHPRPARRGRPRALLAGLAKCAGCGGSMHRDGTSKGTIYRCIPQVRRTGKRCPAPAIMGVRKLDTHVEAIALRELERLQITAVDRTAAVAAVEKELAAAQAELVAYQRATSVSGLGEEMFTEGLKTRSAAVDAARVELGRTRSALGPLPPSVSLRELWPDLSVEERGHVLRGALSAVVVSKGRGPAGERVWIVGADGALLDLPGEVGASGPHDVG